MPGRRLPGFSNWPGFCAGSISFVSNTVQARRLTGDFSKNFMITYNPQPYRRRGSGGTCFAGVCGQDDHSGAPRDGFMASRETGAPRPGFTGCRIFDPAQRAHSKPEFEPGLQTSTNYLLFTNKRFTVCCIAVQYIFLFDNV